MNQPLRMRRSTVALSVMGFAVSFHSPTASHFPEPAATELVATLSPVGGGRIAGYVSLKPGKDSLQISATVEMRGGSLDEQHPWQIRDVRCGESGNIVGSVAMYRKLSVRADGTANIRQNLALPMPNSASHSVTISESINNADVIVACGNLSSK